MPDLKAMVGQSVVALIPIFDKIQFQEVKLLAVEDAGVWVESQKFMNQLLQKVGVTMSPKTMVFFLPFSQIAFIAASLDSPSISEDFAK